MIKILDSEFFGCDFTLDSKISEISDVYEFICFILKCEEYYNLVIFDDEAIFIETNNLSFKDIEDFFIFLRDGYATESIHKHGRSICRTTGGSWLDFYPRAT